MSIPLFLALLTGGASDDTTFRVSRGTSISIEGSNCTVQLRTGTSEQVTVSGGLVDVGGRSVDIECDHGSRRGSAIVVTVPASSIVEVTTTNGSITIEGAPDRLEAGTTNGEIRFSGTGGRIELGSITGAIRVNDARVAGLTVDGVGGGVWINGFSGSLQVESVNGEVDLRGIRSDKVDAASVNGQLRYEGAFAPGGEYNFSTHNGGTTLSLPENVSARMRVTSFAGGFSTAIPATTSTSRGGKGDKNANKIRVRTGVVDLDLNLDLGLEREWVVTYGKGEARVTVESFNGGVRVEKSRSR